MKTIAVLLFDDVEVLDACGPFEVFATSKTAGGDLAFRVVTVAHRAGTIRAVGGLGLVADFGIYDCPPCDVLVVPGGVGRKREVENEELVQWIGERAKTCEIILSVCTGAFLLAKAGLLHGLTVTTHHSAHEELAAISGIAVDTNARYVDNGRIVTAAGIAAGIDASLHVVGRLLGGDRAEATASRMEYSPRFE